MSRVVDWRSYVNENGDFELSTYLYKVIIGLMKASLDLGTLLSKDEARIKAYREQVKLTFKSKWLEIAQVLESFDIIIPCGCVDEYCKLCGGSRYRLNTALSPTEMREISLVVGSEDDPLLHDRLQEGLEKALREVGDDGEHRALRR